MRRGERFLEQQKVELDLLSEILQVVRSTEHRVENLQQEMKLDLSRLSIELDVLHQKVNHMNSRVDSLYEYLHTGFSETKQLVQVTRELDIRFQAAAATLEGKQAMQEETTNQVKQDLQEIQKRILLLES